MIALFERGIVLTVILAFAGTGLGAELELLTREGHRLLGELVSLDSKRLVLRSKSFLHPIEVPVDLVTELKQRRSLPELSVESLLILEDGSRLVRTPRASNDGDHFALPVPRAVIEEAKEISGLSTLPSLVHSLAYSRHRIRLPSEWTQSAATSLVAESTPSAVDGTMGVFDFELPDRFCLTLRIELDDDADFSIGLGDWVATSNGRMDRRGSSISRSPLENNQTAIHCFDSSVTVLRSNQGLTDALGFAIAYRTLELECYVDQVDGRVIVFADGVLQGRIRVPNTASNQPRRSITFTQRGSPLEIKRLSIFCWSGQGTRSSQQLRTLGQEPSQPVAVELTDGSICCGTLMTHDDPSANVFLQHPLTRWQSPVTDVTRVLFANKAAPPTTLPLESPDRYWRELSDGSRPESLSGRLVANSVAGAGQGSAFAFLPHGFSTPQPMRLSPSLRVERSQANQQTKWPILHLITGEKLSLSEIPLVSASDVRFRCPRTSVTRLASSFVARLDFQRETARPDTRLVDMSRSRAKRENSSPPNAWLRSKEGDLLLGELLRLDEKLALLRVRTRPREIPVSRLSAVGWIHPNQVTEPLEETKIERELSSEGEFPLLVTLIDGTELKLTEIRWAEDRFLGRHPLLGNCEFLMEEVLSIVGDRVSVAAP